MIYDIKDFNIVSLIPIKSTSNSIIDEIIPQDSLNIHLLLRNYGMASIHFKNESYGKDLRYESNYYEEASDYESLL